MDAEELTSALKKKKRQLHSVMKHASLVFNSGVFVTKKRKKQLNTLLDILWLQAVKITHKTCALPQSV